MQGLGTGAPAHALKAARLRPRRPGPVQPRARTVTARTRSVGTGDGCGVEDVTRREAHDAEVA